MMSEDRIRLAKFVGIKPKLIEYEYKILTNSRKGVGPADDYFDKPLSDIWENVEDKFWRDDYTDNYTFRRKLDIPEEQWPNFDPFKSANDCELLIRALNDKDWWIIVNIHKNHSCHLTLGMGMRDPRHSWDGDDYKQGICELALKVLDNEQ